MICVLTPSRGLMHSRTVEDIIREMDGYDWRWLLSHGLGIPDCFNDLVDRALRTRADYFLFIEDDMLLPKGIVDELFKHQADIVLADYPVRQNQHCVAYLDDKFAYGGTGLLLVKRHLFESLEPPYFRTHIAYQIQDGRLIAGPAQANYGLHDVDFFQRTKNHTLKVIDMSAGQYFLKEPQLPKWSNDTNFVVEEWRF